MPARDPRDVIIIGGGAGGVISLYYARRAGLDALLIERQPGVGGLWRQLPAWQDIQINPLDWTLGDIPISGEKQPSIAANIQAWVDRFDLAPAMLLDTPVTRARSDNGGWTVETPRGEHRSRHLIAATGGHNRPVIPPVVRDGATVREFHSSALRDPAALRGQDVLVVGGGASAYDLLDLALEHGARHVRWVYRSPRWMVPTRKPKHIAGGIRDLAKLQMQGATVDQINAGIRQDLLGRYEKFGLQSIMPAEPFDFRRHQLVPGRRGMIEHFASIERHRGEVTRIAGSTVELSGGERLDVNMVLWGTGYEVDLGYFDNPALASIRQVDELSRRCGGFFRSLDEPNLFFLAGQLDSTGSAPWAYAHSARSIVSHIRGTANLPSEPMEGKFNHFDLAKFLARHDPVSFPPDSWFAAYRDLATNHPPELPMPLP